MTFASTFGLTLRGAREARGLTLREVAQTTAIRRDYLQALEDGQLGGLPEATFARAYLRRYARELGLSPGPLLAEFDRLIQPPPGPGPAPSAEAGADAPPTPPLGTGRMVLIAGLLGLLLLVGALLRRQAPGAAAPPAPVPTVAAQPASVPSPPVSPPPQGTVRLSVQSLPDGAQVYLDNRSLGTAPVRSFPVGARARAELRVEAAGRVPLRQTINLRGSRNLRATLPLGGGGSVARSLLTDLNTGVGTRTPPALAPAVPPPSASNPTPVSQTGVSQTPVSQTGVPQIAVRFVGARDGP